MSVLIPEVLYSIIGSLIGSGITLLSQVFFDYRQVSKKRRKKCIDKINDIPQKLDSLNDIIDVIIDFIRADFNNEDRTFEDDQIFNSFSRLYTEKRPYFWNILVKDIYILLPKTFTKNYFRILDEIMKSTENLSEGLGDYLESFNTIDEGLIELQDSLMNKWGKYFVAKYVIYKLKDEFFSIIVQKTVREESSSFYKKHKKIIDDAIKKNKI